MLTAVTHTVASDVDLDTLVGIVSACASLERRPPPISKNMEEMFDVDVYVPVHVPRYESISNYRCRVCTVARHTTASRDIPRLIGTHVRYLNIQPRHFRFEAGNRQLKVSADPRQIFSNL